MNPPVLPALQPDWAAPPAVRARMSTRAGGVSRAPFDTLNLRPPELPGADLDDPAAVRENRRRWAEAIGAPCVWLEQVHGARVVRLGLDALDAHRASLPRADAAITTEPGIACTVLVADCLPVLLCTRSGSGVGAAHAGWRGLAGGVLEATVAALGEATGEPPARLLAWLGPCIGPEAFEVGADVLQAFDRSAEAALGADAPRFRHAPRPDGSPRWRADLAGLARDRLLALGLAAEAVTGGGGCTVSDPARFFSFRRERVTGRMAASIAIG